MLQCKMLDMAGYFKGLFGVFFGVRWAIKIGCHREAVTCLVMRSAISADFVANVK